MIDIEVARELGGLSAEVGVLSKNMVIQAINASSWIHGDTLPVPSSTGTANSVLGEKVVGVLRLCWTHLMQNGFKPTKSDFLNAINKLPPDIVQEEV